MDQQGAAWEGHDLPTPSGSARIFEADVLAPGRPRLGSPVDVLHTGAADLLCNYYRNNRSRPASGEPSLYSKSRSNSPAHAGAVAPLTKSSKTLERRYNQLTVRYVKVTDLLGERLRAELD